MKCNDNDNNIKEEFLMLPGNAGNAADGDQSTIK